MNRYVKCNQSATVARPPADVQIWMVSTTALELRSNLLTSDNYWMCQLRVRSLYIQTKRIVKKYWTNTCLKNLFIGLLKIRLADMTSCFLSKNEEYSKFGADWRQDAIGSPSSMIWRSLFRFCSRWRVLELVSSMESDVICIQQPFNDFWVG